MAFLQNFHLSPGQTIRSTRGFKWNSGPNQQQQQQQQQSQEELPPSSSPLRAKENNARPFNDTSNNNTVYGGDPLLTTPIRSEPQLQQQQNVTDFNYTPSHQKPYIQPQSGTTVTTHQDIKHIVEMTLGSEGVLNQAVKLPRGEDENEWLAVHCVDFYNQINMLYGTITEFCSPQSCPRMIATNEYEYLWSKGKGIPPVSVSAPKYVEYLMRWCQDQFDDEAIFPAKKDGVFPERFIDKIIIPILRRLFRVYAHIYCHHFNEILELNLQTVLNTSFRHFCLFAEEFKLLRPADFGPLLELVTELRDR
ncbi:Mob1p NDAI_0B03650 [Naumovozyma dairenensis CBS 421]|uniref:Uncharacterized protein n=1 Tax=Naumovozyma dairenensis (strain ATCC 10597 / BCRC 20456 / CBS 421 / NBRC 0211 / NRRL Y-12639) TaxID=1071378 RepID=G0W6I8_NAUDC|nr:hypothetical protein NDAI_0B03650 [Naumovozyma dairenensis CBS 421]CCD23399.1 hypothetical protein NDAI_0B03650 [Naumovozyma dairenensis CBS 421]